MSTIDYVTTPIEMIMEDNKHKQNLQAPSSPETEPTAEPTSPSFVFVTPGTSEMKAHSSNPELASLASLIATNTEAAEGSRSAGDDVAGGNHNRHKVCLENSILIRCPLMIHCQSWNQFAEMIAAHLVAHDYSLSSFSLSHTTNVYTHP
jgi:hypothetical protein